MPLAPDINSVDCCVRLDAIAAQILQAAEDDQFEEMVTLNHILRTTVMEVIALMEDPLSEGGDTKGINSIISALEIVRQSSRLVDGKRRSLDQKYQQDRHLRLVYSDGAK